MPQLTLPASADGLPLTRRDIEQHVDALIDLLDALDGDTDLEPSLGSGDDREGDESDFEPDTDGEPTLGYSSGGQDPERYPQDGFGYYANADAGRDLEDDHDGREPDVNDEPSLGWTSHDNQASAAFHANNLGTADLEAGTGAVRKKRPPSKTGGAVYRGAAVLGCSEPPRNPRTVRMPMARPKGRAAR